MIFFLLCHKVYICYSRYYFSKFKSRIFPYISFLIGLYYHFYQTNTFPLFSAKCFRQKFDSSKFFLNHTISWSLSLFLQNFYICDKILFFFDENDICSMFSFSVKFRENLCSLTNSSSLKDMYFDSTLNVL